MGSPHGKELKVSPATGRRVRVLRGEADSMLAIICAVVAVLLLGMMAALFIGPHRTVRPRMVNIPQANTSATTSSESPAAGSTDTPATSTASSPTPSTPACACASVHATSAARNRTGVRTRERRVNSVDPHHQRIERRHGAISRTRARKAQKPGPVDAKLARRRRRPHSSNSTGATAYPLQ